MPEGTGERQLVGCYNCAVLATVFNDAHHSYASACHQIVPAVSLSSPLAFPTRILSVSVVSLFPSLVIRDRPLPLCCVPQYMCRWLALPGLRGMLWCRGWSR